MEGYINGYNFWGMEAEKYYAPTKNKGLKEMIQNAIYSNDYIGSRKVDGHWYMMIKDDLGNLYLRGRSKSVNGDYLDKIDWVPHLKEEFDKLPNGTVTIGEIYFRGNEGSKNVTTIMGCLVNKAIERQNKGNKLSYYAFDCLALNGELLLNKPLKERIKYLAIIETITGVTYVNSAKYYNGDKLFKFLAWCREKGYEGIVLQRKDGIYEPGKRPARKSIKVKKELDKEADCFLTGNYKNSTMMYDGKEIQDWKYWLNQKTDQKMEGLFYDGYFAGQPLIPITKGYFYGWAGAVEIGVVKGEEIVSVGWISNVTEEVKKGIITGIYTKRVVKIHAMEIEEDTKCFRHAKIMEWREDINWQDCTYEKIFGNE